MAEIPLCSVLVVCYNHEPFLRQALDGILLQETSFPFEIVIGDDCSTDNSANIIMEYAKRNPELIRPFCYQKNLGLFGRNNFVKTLGECRGDYVAFFESDDYWTDPKKLEKQVLWLEEHHEYALSYHAVEILTEASLDYDHKIYSDPIQDATTKDIIAKHFIPTLSLVFRRKLLDNLPPFYFKSSSSDIVIELIISLSGKARYFSEKMGVYRNHGKGITKRDHEWNIQKTIECLNLYQGFNEFSKFQFSDEVNTVQKGKLIYAYELTSSFKGYKRILLRWKLFVLACKYLKNKNWSEKKDTLYTFLIPRVYRFLSRNE